MRGPQFKYEEAGVDINAIELNRQSLRRKLISAARHLYIDRGITDFKVYSKDKDVAEFYTLYGEYTDSARQIPLPEQKLLALLEEHMLPFDAELITEPEKLEQLDEEIVNEYLREAEEGGFSDLREKVNEYRAEIVHRLKK